MNGKRYIAIGLSVILGICMTACQKEEEPEEEAAVAVEVQTPRLGELTVDTTYIGTVAPQEQVYVIPKTSGTVTETFFEVGDQVKEGDVLFKIDDEAAQLQMASARASYDSAQAGVTAQNGGARDLQNYQTEEQIRQLRESLDDTDVKINELEDTLGDLRDAGSKLSSAKKQAQEGADMAGTAYYAAQLELQTKQAQLAETQKQLEEIQKKIADAALGGSADGSEDGSADVGADTGTDPGLQQQAEALQKQVEELQSGMPALELRLNETKTQFDQAQTGVNQLQAQIDSINASKTQVKSGIDSAEDGRDTIGDNLAMAEQAYAITQNEIYPETDAVSAAQLQAASIGIDSAQMQLDFCTVTSPISGIVESVSVEKNGMAAAGNPAYIISNKESMTVTFHVAEKAKNTLAVGDHVKVERDGTDYDGVITEIGTMTNPQTKLFQVKATVAGAGAALPNGVSVKVYATTQRDTGKLILPYDSIYFSAGDAYVYCVENGQIVKTEVTVGLMSDTEAVIEEGVTQESQIVSNWSSKLRNGVEADIVSMNGEPVAEEMAKEGPGEAKTTPEEETEENPEEMPAGDTEVTGEAE